MADVIQLSSDDEDLPPAKIPRLDIKVNDVVTLIDSDEEGPTDLVIDQLLKENKKLRTTQIELKQIVVQVNMKPKLSQPSDVILLDDEDTLSASTTTIPKAKTPNLVNGPLIENKKLLPTRITPKRILVDEVNIKSKLSQSSDVILLDDEDTTLSASTSTTPKVETPDLVNGPLIENKKLLPTGLTPKRILADEVNMKPNKSQRSGVTLLDHEDTAVTANTSTIPKVKTPDLVNGRLIENKKLLPAGITPKRILVDEANTHPPNQSQFGEVILLDDEDKTGSTAAKLKELLEEIKIKVTDSSMKETLIAKSKKLWTLFEKNEYASSEEFKDFLNKCQEGLNRGVHPIEVAHRIFKELKDNETVMVPEEKLLRIQKLERTMNYLVKRIKELEESEIDFSDDNSSFIVQDRLERRLNKVYARYCRYLGRNQYRGRPIHDRLNFRNSKYSEINDAINRIYKNSLNVPNFAEFEDSLLKSEMKLDERVIKTESVECFKILIEMMRRKRLLDLRDIHEEYFKHDPQVEDESLKLTLRQSGTLREKQMSELIDKFANLQESGQDYSDNDADEESNENSNNDSATEAWEKNLAGNQNEDRLHELMGMYVVY